MDNKHKKGLSFKNLKTLIKQIGGTYEPHGYQKEKHPFWLDLAGKVINKALERT